MKALKGLGFTELRHRGSHLVIGGLPERQPHDYRRNAASNRFC
ncbi:MAG: hypothetical protein ACREEC_12105 [Thermoplasmata archaeon]